MVHYTIRVSGRVQGVFFRASTREAAERLGISGWVRNEADGSVLIEAEGSPEAMQAFLDWCRQGPKHAQVQDIHWEEGDVSHFQDFTIQR